MKKGKKANAFLPDSSPVLFTKAKINVTSSLIYKLENNTIKLIDGYVWQEEIQMFKFCLTFLIFVYLSLCLIQKW